jgi:ABC-type multidrug transport system ATPase subunit
VLSCPQWRTRPGLTAVVGLNGAGKSTLLGLLSGRLGPSRGEVELADRANVLPQVARFSSASSVVDLYRYLAALRGVRRRDREPEVQSALELAGMVEHAAIPMRQLSGGWQQRALVGQCLLGSPTILLLDEPTASLDVGAARSVWELMKALSGRLPVVVATHEASASVEFCDQMVTVQAGVVGAVLEGDRLRADLGQGSESAESFLLSLIEPEERSA